MTPIGQIAYEAYCAKTGWKSLATGADLRWEKLHVDIQEAWQSAAETVLRYVAPAVRFDERLRSVSSDRPSDAA